MNKADLIKYLESKGVVKGSYEMVEIDLLELWNNFYHNELVDCTITGTISNGLCHTQYEAESFCCVRYNYDSRDIKLDIKGHNNICINVLNVSRCTCSISEYGWIDFHLFVATGHATDDLYRYGYTSIVVR